ncbi:MAG: DNA-formamidopyrimidine glycosylase family protein [Longimicrobiales bacterium]|nr:DNA-formamidopyrimidine glycosylase family protein [Longimicrobiales bacterium]
MPELPDVEVFRSTADDHGLHRPVETVGFSPDGMTMTAAESTIRDALLGHTLTATRRWGKHLFLRSGEERQRWLRLHFGMTGTLEALGPDADTPEHTRLRLDLRGGSALAYVCPRKLGEIGLVTDPATFADDHDLGPDYLHDGVGPATFRDRIADHGGTIKSALMDQERMAGLGNVYADETLFHAGWHPETPVSQRSDGDLEDLFGVALDVIRGAIHARVDPDRMPDDWLLPRREDGAPCPRCDGTLRKTEVSGRPTYHCDQHQAR